jgi:hypothetical protein
MRRDESGIDCAFKEKRGNMRIVVAIVAGLAVAQALTAAANAQNNQPRRKQAQVQSQVVERSAAGTVIQPTRTIIHHEDGSTTVITVPRRSYLDTGTEVAVGDRKFQDYAFPPGGDPGRPYWFYGPDVRGAGSFPIPPPGYIPGLNTAVQRLNP